eukprot:301458_1
MATEQAEGVAMEEYISTVTTVSVNTEDKEDKIQNEKNEEINNEHVIEFISMLRDPSQSCFNSKCIYCCWCEAGCKIGLWTGIHLWFLLLIIGNSLNIHQYKTLIDTLNVDCPAEIFEYHNNYYECTLQTNLNNIGRMNALIIIYGLIVFSSINILINCISIYSIYTCRPINILLQIIFLLFQCIVTLTWIIYNWDNSLWNLFVIHFVDVFLHLFAATTYFKVYRWAKFYKSCNYLNPELALPY